MESCPTCTDMVETESEMIRVWEGTTVKNRSVTLTPFIPTTNKFEGMGVIICPGGSYCWLDSHTEGVLVAKWLNSQGIAAFLLKYRTQGYIPFLTHSRLLFKGNQHPNMIEDIQRAIQLVRENALCYGVNPKRVGVMGFSAGGHLAMSSLCYHATNYLAPHKINTQVSLMPDFAALLYPVVSMSHSVTHKRSRRALLGEYGKHKADMRELLSLEKHVPDDCPPVFLVNCKDDPVVKYQNSELLDAALTLKHVTHKYIQYEKGRHGFGASDRKGTPECRQWRDEFIHWIQTVI